MTYGKFSWRRLIQHSVQGLVAEETSNCSLAKLLEANDLLHEVTRQWQAAAVRAVQLQSGEPSEPAVQPSTRASFGPLESGAEQVMRSTAELSLQELPGLDSISAEGRHMQHSSRSRLNAVNNVSSPSLSDPGTADLLGFSPNSSTSRNLKSLAGGEQPNGTEAQSKAGPGTILNSTGQRSFAAAHDMHSSEQQIQKLQGTVQQLRNQLALTHVEATTAAARHAEELMGVKRQAIARVHQLLEEVSVGFCIQAASQPSLQFSQCLVRPKSRVNGHNLAHCSP